MKRRGRKFQILDRSETLLIAKLSIIEDWSSRWNEERKVLEYTTIPKQQIKMIESGRIYNDLKINPPHVYSVATVFSSSSAPFIVLHAKTAHLTRLGYFQIPEKTVSLPKECASFSGSSSLVNK